MSSPIEVQGAPEVNPLTGERRKYQRHSGKARVEVVREGDNQRLTVPVELFDLSSTGLGLLAPTPFTPEERVRIRLKNEIRRFVRDVRGVVRWVQPQENGKFRIGIELYSRFAALDIQLLKQMGATGESGEKVWV